MTKANPLRPAIVQFVREILMDASQQTGGEQAIDIARKQLAAYLDLPEVVAASIPASDVWAEFEVASEEFAHGTRWLRGEARVSVIASGAASSRRVCSPGHVKDLLRAVAELRSANARRIRTDTGADSKTDNGKKSPAVVPVNLDVARLAREMKRRLPKGDSKRKIALDFTGGNTKRAENLLRQLRRFPALLD